MCALTHSYRMTYMYFHLNLSCQCPKSSLFLLLLFVTVALQNITYFYLTLYDITVQYILYILTLFQLFVRKVFYQNLFTGLMYTSESYF